MTEKMRDDGHLPATKADLSGFATKADLLDFATKADLRDFATKSDLRDFPTKGEIAAMRDDIITAVRDMIRPLALTTAHHSAELADIRGYMKDKLVTRDEFHSRMDGFARRVDDFDWSAAKNLDRLDDHEKRLKKLESPKS